jgi:ParB family chromosome partitioning protein
MSTRINFNQTEEARRNRLSALADNTDQEPDAEPARTADPFTGRKQLREACMIQLERIIPDPDQPRREFDAEALARLAGSLRSRGQLQPIRVRWDEGKGVYVIVVGERRWRAARLAGMETVACVVAGGTPTAAEVLEDQLVENAVRADLKPTEQARAFRTLMDALELTQERLAERLEISQTTVSQALSLLNLDASVQARVDSGELTVTAAYQIAKVEGGAAQRGLADHVIDGQLSRDQLAEVVSTVKARMPARVPVPRPAPVTYDLGDGTVVVVKWKKANGTGATQALRRALKLSQATPEQAA